jgi:hypothetical protein
MKTSSKARFDALKVAASALAISVGAGMGGSAFAQAVDYGGAPEATNDIVANHTVPPGPGNPATGANFANSPNVLDPAGSVNGIGQMISFIQTGPTSAGLSLCTGTLINPRTVITAAHCVYNFPAHMYGSDTGTGGGVNGNFGTGGVLLTSSGIPISFGFSSTNRCLGVVVNGCAVGSGPYEQWRDSNFSTNTALNIYNGNQVFYLTGAQPVALGGGGEFANADIALVTLDTHADGIPTWTLLFSPLPDATHAIITGYGGAGVGLAGIGSLAGIDYRRRSAENMIVALMTNNDWVDSPAINPGNTAFAAHQHAIYWMDFDDPDFDVNNLPANFFTNTAPPGGRNNGYYDFNGLMGVTLANEGATAGGDSGGPLIVDQRWDIPVVAGVLTGSWSFNGGISTYGQFNVYPPLFQFWEDIVQNNPYKYVGNRAGIRSWMDPNNWVQLMDPNYAVIGPDGELLNSLPDTHQGGADGAVDRFGTLCFLETDCTTFDGPGAPTGGGAPILTPGGPGTLNFVPNNVEPVNSATPGATVQARYYDVTLSAIGETWLNTSVTIDRFTLDGLLTGLDVRSGGTLNVWSDFTVDSGFLNVDGRINSGEALMVHGLLTGRGTFNPTYLTSVDGVIAPGDLVGVGTLTVQGDVVLASASELLIELGRTTSDVLRVTADPAQGTTGNISLGGGLWLTPSSQGGGPRYGNVYTIVQADGLVVDTFDDVNGFLGVLRPRLTYTTNSVKVKLEAGSFVDLILHHPDLMPFAFALDQLRELHYADLYSLYGEIDLMDPMRLSAAFSSMAPGSLMDAHGLMAMQQSSFGMTMFDRISLIARAGGSPGDFSVAGDPGSVLSFGGDPGLGNAGELSMASMLTTDSRHVSTMPGGYSAFITGGYSDARASAAAGRTALRSDESLRTWQVVGGLERTMDNLTLGIAAGYSRGQAAQMTSSAFADNDVAQTAVYGVYSLGDGVYVSGLVGAGYARTGTDRRFAAGTLDYRMHGDTRGDLFLASLEAGMNIDLSPSFTLTPNVALREYAVRVRGFEENGGETALAIDEQSYRRAEARLGARLAGEHTFSSGWTLAPSLDAVAVANLVGADEGGLWARFAAAPDVPFYLPGAPRDDFWGEVLGGLRLVRGETSFALQFETSVGREELYEDRYMARYAQRF